MNPPIDGFFLQQLRFHLEPKAPLHMPAYNKGNVIRGGFGSTFRRIVCHASCRDPETCELRAHAERDHELKQISSLRGGN